MAGNKSQDDILRELDDLDLEPLDLSWDDDVPNDKPITSFGRGVRRGIINRSAGISFLGRVLRSALPDGFAKLYTAGRDALTTVSEVHDHVISENADSILDATEHLQERLGLLSDKAPKALRQALESRLSEYRDKVDRLREARRRDPTGDHSADEDALQALLGQFTIQSQQDQADQQERLAEERLKGEQVERSVRDRVTEAQSLRQEELLRAIDGKLAFQNRFSVEMTRRYQYHSLEIGLKQYHALRDIRNIEGRMYTGVMEGLKAVIHNTALPEQTKQLSQSDQRRGKLGIINTGLNGYLNNFYNQISTNIKRSMAEGLSNAFGGLSMASMLPTDAEGRGGVAGGMLSEILRNGVAPIIGSRFRPAMERLSSRFGARDQQAEYYLDNIPSIAQSYAENFNQPTGWRSALHGLLSRHIPGYYLDPMLNSSGYQNIDQAAIFNQMTQRSITEIIPGYLSRVVELLGEISGKGGDNSYRYNVVTGRFGSEEESLNSLRDRIVTPMERDNVNYALDSAMARYDESNNLGAGAQDALRRQLMNDAARNRHFDPRRMIDDSTYENVDEDTRNELINHFRGRYTFDENDRLVHDAESRTRLNRDARLFSELRASVPLPQNEIRRLLESGRQEDLSKLGLITSRNGRDAINYDNVFDLYHRRSDSRPFEGPTDLGRWGPGHGPGPAPTGGDDRPNPVGPDGSLKEPLYVSGRGTPVLVPEGFDNDEYLDANTGRVIKRVRDIRHPVKNRRGQIIVSGVQLEAGLRDRYGHTVVKVNSEIRRRIRNFVNPGSDDGPEEKYEGEGYTAPMEAVYPKSAPEETPSEKPATVRERVNERVDGVRRRTVDHYRTLRDKVRDAKPQDRVTDLYKEGTRRAVIKAQDFRDGVLKDERTGKVIKSASDITGGIVDHLGNRITEARDVLKDRSGRVVNQAKTKAEEVRQYAKESFDKLKAGVDHQSVRDKVKETVDQVRSRGTTLRDRLSDRVNEYRKAAPDRTTVVEEMRRRAEEARERVTGHARQASESVRERVRNARNSKRARRSGDYIREQYEQFFTRASDSLTSLTALGDRLRSGNVKPEEVARNLYKTAREAKDRVRRYAKNPGLFELDKEHLNEFIEKAKERARTASDAGTDHLSRTRASMQSVFDRIKDRVRGEDPAQEHYNEMSAQDVYVKGRKQPAILARDMLEGRVFDKETGKQIRSLEDISGSVVNEQGDVVLTAEEVEGGLFTKFGNRINLHARSLRGRFARASGFGAVGEQARNISRVVKAVGNVPRTLFGISRRAFDLYVVGETYPRLTALRMRAGEYIDLNTERTVFSVDDIRGPVATKDGNIVLEFDDLKNLCDVTGKRIRLSGLLKRLFQKAGRAWWKFTKAYYKGLFKVAPKVLGSVGRFGIRTAGRVLGNRALMGVGRGAGRAASAYARGTGNFYSKLGRIATAPASSLTRAAGGALVRTVGGLTGIRSLRGYGRNKGPSERITPESTTSRRKRFFRRRNVLGTRDLSSEERNDPQLSLLAGLNDKIAQLIPERIRAGSWQDIFAKRRGKKDEEKSKEDKDSKDPRSLFGTLSNGIKSLRDLFKRRKEEKDDDDGNIDIDLSSRRGRSKERRRRRARERLRARKALKGGGSRLGRIGSVLGKAGRLGGRALGGIGGALIGGADIASSFYSGGLKSGTNAILSNMPNMMGGAGMVAGDIARGGSSLLKGSGALLRGGAGLLSGIGTGATALLGEGALGAAAAAASPLLVGAVVVGGVALAGYGIYKGWQWYQNKYRSYLLNVRLAQYGVYGNSNLTDNVLKLEGAITKDLNGNSIDLTKYQTGVFAEIFGLKNADQARVQNAFAWFKYRFTPVFTKHLQALNGIDPSVSLLEADDKLKGPDKARYLDQISFPYSGTTPYNYRFSPSNEELTSGPKEIEDLFHQARDALSEADKQTAKTVSKPRDRDGNLITEDKTIKSADVSSFKRRLADAQAKMKAEAAAGVPSAVSNSDRFREMFTGGVGVGKGNQTGNVTGVQELRFNEYGLPDFAKNRVSDILGFEKFLKDKLKFTRDGASLDIDFNDVIEEASRRFGFSRVDEVATTRFRQWFNGRFAPVFTTWANATMDVRPHADLSDIDDKLSYDEQLKIAKAVIGAKGKLFGKDVSVFDVPYTPYSEKSTKTPADNDAIIKRLEDLSQKRIVGTDPNLNKDLVQGGAKGNLMRPEAYRADQARKEATDRANAANSLEISSRLNANVLGGKTPSGNAVSPTDMSRQLADVATNGAGGRSQGKVPYTKGEVAAFASGSGGLWSTLPMPAQDGQREAAIPLFQQVAKMTGVDANVLATMASIESGFRGSVKAPGSSAAGLFQFIDGTWAQTVKAHGDKYGIKPGPGRDDPQRLDPRINALMGAEYLKENAEGLRKTLGRDPKDTELYLAHFAGLGGARQLLKADPNADAASLFSSQAKANPTIFYQGGRSRTVQGVIDELERRVQRNRGGKIPAVSAKDIEMASTDPTGDQPLGDPNATASEGDSLRTPGPSARAREALSNQNLPSPGGGLQTAPRADVPSASSGDATLNDTNARTENVNRNTTVSNAVEKAQQETNSAQQVQSDQSSLRLLAEANRLQRAQLDVLRSIDGKMKTGGVGQSADRPAVSGDSSDTGNSPSAPFSRSTSTPNPNNRVSNGVKKW